MCVELARERGPRGDDPSTRAFKIFEARCVIQRQPLRTLTFPSCLSNHHILTVTNIIMIRPSPTFLSAARSTFSAQASSAPRLARTYATSPPAPGGSQSNLPLFLALGGLGGLGAWYGMGGFGDGAKAEAKKAVAKVEGAASALSGALSKDEFRDFTLKELVDALLNVRATS